VALHDKGLQGEEVSFGVTSETDDPDKVKEGEHIIAVIREDRIALSIKNMKKKSGAQG
jgi:predicted thioesterase